MSGGVLFNVYRSKIRHTKGFHIQSQILKMYFTQKECGPYKLRITSELLVELFR